MRKTRTKNALLCPFQLHRSQANQFYSLLYSNQKRSLHKFQFTMHRMIELTFTPLSVLHIVLIPIFEKKLALLR